jgi:hypothetical protein
MYPTSYVEKKGSFEPSNHWQRRFGSVLISPAKLTPPNKQTNKQTNKQQMLCRPALSQHDLGSKLQLQQLLAFKVRRRVPGVEMALPLLPPSLATATSTMRSRSRSGRWRMFGAVFAWSLLPGCLVGICGW